MAAFFQLGSTYRFNESGREFKPTRVYTVRQTRTLVMEVLLGMDGGTWVPHRFTANDTKTALNPRKTTKL